MFTAEHYYWVLHLDESSYRPSPDVEFAIQLLDKNGQEIGIEYITRFDRQVLITGCQVPSAVVEAAKRQPRSAGAYVNDDGIEIEPF